MKAHLKIDGLYSGTYPAGPFIATQCLIIDSDNKSIIISPGINFEDSEIQSLISQYPLKAIIAPNSYHNMGVSLVQKQFDVPCYAAQNALMRLSKLNIKNLLNIDQFSVLREDFKVFIPNAQKLGESWVLLGLESYRVLIVTDAFFNLKRVSNNFLMSLVSRLMDNAPGFKVSRLFSMIAITNKVEYSLSVRNFFDQNHIDEMIVAHGDPQIGNIKELVDQSLKERGL